MSEEQDDIRTGTLEAHDTYRGYGIHWCFNEAGKGPEERRSLLKKGDIVIVFNDAARTQMIWGGVVDLDYESHREEFGPYGNSAQVLEPYGHINGLQKNMDPLTWARMFETEKPAIFIRPASLRKK